MLANDLLRPQVTKRILSALQFHLTANAWYVNAARHLELGLFCVLNSQLLIPLTCSVTMFSSLCLLHQYLDRPLHFIPFPTHFLGDNYQYISPHFLLQGSYVFCGFFSAHSVRGRWRRCRAMRGRSSSGVPCAVPPGSPVGSRRTSATAPRPPPPRRDPTRWTFTASPSTARCSGTPSAGAATRPLSPTSPRSVVTSSLSSLVRLW
jgi:hypothetical protein